MALNQTGVQIELLGKDGNVFNIISQTVRGLKKAGLDDVAKEYQSRALKSKTYEEVLRLTSSVVIVV